MSTNRTANMEYMSASDHGRTVAELEAELDTLRQELARKNLLLQEAVHRSRSTTASILSLLALQVREMRDPAVRAALELARARIAAMGRVHRLLHEAPDGKALDLNRVLKELALGLAEGLEARERNIFVSVVADAPDINISAAMPLALIAHELIANALRYAFRGRDKGRVVVVLRVDRGRLTLTVRDDGVGISDKSLAHGTTGILLMRALAEELGARLDFMRDRGTLATLTMPASLAV